MLSFGTRMNKYLIYNLVLPLLILIVLTACNSKSSTTDAPDFHAEIARLRLIDMEGDFVESHPYEWFVQKLASESIEGVLIPDLMAGEWIMVFESLVS